MGDSALTPTARLEELTSLYERQAYVAWNVALRTAISEAHAAGAARRAFLSQVAQPDEPRAALDAARFAADSAPAVDSRDIEDPVLAATAQLAPAQRAALALDELAGAPGTRIAAALGIDAAAESEVRARAHEQLASLLGVSPGEAREAYSELPWADPPEALWTALYPELHGAVTQQARALARPEPPAPPHKRAWLRGVPRAALVAAGVLAVAGVAWAAMGGGDSGGDAGEGDTAGNAGLPGEPGSSSPPATGDAAEGAAAPEELSPEELNRLRQEELEDLERFTRRKADKSLPPRARRRAARKVSDLVELAQTRQRASERRELALRRALARERQARIRERNRREDESGDSSPAPERDEQEPARQQPSRQTPPPRQQPERRDEDKPADDDQAECLYDAASGSYICPE
jgi:hypothetical protein